jgi:histidinol dehydrogenase
VSFTDADGVSLGWRVRPLAAGGGLRAGRQGPLPVERADERDPRARRGRAGSSWPRPDPTQELLAAAFLAGSDRVFDLGGGQAIAALAYGTESVPRVDKIVGPGNIYVACAKKLVFGTVAVDGHRGPLGDPRGGRRSGRPRVAAADLLSQAEHDELAYPLLVTPLAGLRRARGRRGERAARGAPPPSIASVSVRDRGWCFVAGDLDEAARVATRSRPSTSRCWCATPRRCFAKSAPRARPFSATSPPRPRGTTSRAPRTCSPRAAPCASRRRSACTTSPCAPR